MNTAGHMKNGKLYKVNFLECVFNSDDNYTLTNGSGMSNHNHKQKMIFQDIIGYLNLKDLFNLKLVCKKINSEMRVETWKEYVKSVGISKDLLKIKNYLWDKFLNIDVFKEEVYRTYVGNIKEQNLYKNVLMEIEKIKKGEPAIITDDAVKNKLRDCFDDISRDVNRTFHNDRFHSGSLQGELSRVLEAVSYIRRDIGYCQGMNFIAGALICLTDSEEKAFWIFLIFLDNYELKNLFIKHMPDYAIRVYQLNYYVQKYLPEVYYHFKKRKIPFDMIYSRWLITILSQYLTFDYLLIVWTLFMIDRWKCVIKFCLIFLHDIQGQLISLDIEGLSDFLRSDYMVYHQNKLKAFKLYSNGRFKVTNKELRKLRDNYYIDLAKEKLSDTESRWDKDQLEPLERYLTEKNKIDQIVKKDIANYKLVMEEIDKRYSAAQKVYLEQLKVVKGIKNKLEIEIEKKNSYESIINSLKKEINNIRLINSMNKIKGSDNSLVSKKDKRNKSFLTNIFNYGFNVSDNGKNKIMIIEQELLKIQKFLDIVDEEVNKINKFLLENYHTLDEKKYLLEQVEKEKFKRKFMMEKYLVLSEKKEDELVKDLSEKLKLSEKFIKNYQF